MIDEAHELNRNTEVLLGVLKKIRRKRKDLRIIVCSATIDAEAFLDFFIPKKIRKEAPVVGTPPMQDRRHEKKKRKRWGRVDAADVDKDDDTGKKQGGGINIENHGTIISIDGRQHPVDILYAEKPVADYVKATVDLALRIHIEKSYDDGDILCFLATGEEVDRSIYLADELLPSLASNKHQKQVTLLPLYGTLPHHVQSRVFRPKNGSDLNKRRIIFATNIAETSVTVPHISYVIDSGYVKMPFFHTQTGFERLIIW